MLYVDLLSNVVTETYLAERERLVSEEERGARELVERIVDGTPLTPEERELARSSTCRCATAMCHSRPRSRAPRRDATPRSRHVCAAKGALAVTEGDRVFGLGLAPPELSDLGEGPRALLALGEETPRTRARDRARGAAAAGRPRPARAPRRRA